MNSWANISPLSAHRVVRDATRYTPNANDVRVEADRIDREVRDPEPEPGHQQRERDAQRQPGQRARVISCAVAGGRDEQREHEQRAGDLARGRDRQPEHQQEADVESAHRHAAGPGHVGVDRREQQRPRAERQAPPASPAATISSVSTWPLVTPRNVPNSSVSSARQDPVVEADRNRKPAASPTACTVPISGRLAAAAARRRARPAARSRAPPTPHASVVAERGRQPGERGAGRARERHHRRACGRRSSGGAAPCTSPRPPPSPRRSSPPRAR